MPEDFSFIAEAVLLLGQTAHLRFAVLPATRTEPQANAVLYAGGSSRTLPYSLPFNQAGQVPCIFQTRRLRNIGAMLYGRKTQRSLGFRPRSTFHPRHYVVSDRPPIDTPDKGHLTGQFRANSLWPNS